MVAMWTVVSVIQRIILEGKYEFSNPKGCLPISRQIRIICKLPISLFDVLHFVKGQDMPARCHKNNENSTFSPPHQLI